MSIKRKTIHHVGACLENMHRILCQCKDDRQRAEMQVVIRHVRAALEAAHGSVSIGASERRPKTCTFDLEAAARGELVVVQPHQVASARVAASAWGKRHGMALSVRKREDGSAVIALRDDDGVF